MNLLNYLKNILGESKKVLANGSYPSVFDEIKRILGLKKWKILLLETIDKKELIEKAAKKIDLEELELIKIIADRFDIAVALKPKAIDIRFLPDEITFFELRNLGLLPIIDQEIMGMVCVDPANLNLLPNLYRGSNIFLSSWRIILASLDQSENDYKLAKKKLQISEYEEAEKISMRVLSQIAEQAVGYQANKIKFHFTSMKLFTHLVMTKEKSGVVKLNKRFLPR